MKRGVSDAVTAQAGGAAVAGAGRVEIDDRRLAGG
jgi:hypothetical protein